MERARIGPGDPGIAGNTGFAAVETLDQLKIALGEVAKDYKEIYTLVPHRRHRLPARTRLVGMGDLGRAEADAARAAPAIGAMRQVESPEKSRCSPKPSNFPSTRSLPP